MGIGNKKCEIEMRRKITAPDSFELITLKQPPEYPKEEFMGIIEMQKTINQKPYSMKLDIFSVEYYPEQAGQEGDPFFILVNQRLSYTSTKDAHWKMMTTAKNAFKDIAPKGMEFKADGVSIFKMGKSKIVN